VIRSTTLDAQDSAMLAAMGLRCDSTVQLCREGEPCIVSVMSGGRFSCRIGLARPLARAILVERIEEPGSGA
jgi:FeoA domain